MTATHSTSDNNTPVTTRRVRMRTVAALLAPATAAALALAPAPALAHDVLIDSDPEDGDSLDAVPEEVVLTFNNSPNEGGGNAIVVTGPDGETTYEEGELTFDGPDVSVDVGLLDEAGEYSIDYQIVSSDGHPIQDTLVFSVSEDAVEEAAPDEPEDEMADEADEAEEATEEEDAADEAADGEAAAEEPAAAAGEGGISPVVIAIVIAAGLGGIAAAVLVAARMRNRPGSGSAPGDQPTGQ